jgi:hypothetical protein
VFDKYAALAYEVVEKSLRTRLGDGIDVLRLSRHVASLVRASGLAAGDYLSPTPADVAFASNANFTDRQRDEVKHRTIEQDYFFLDFGLRRLRNLQFIQYYVAGFYKPTIPQSPPSHLRDYGTCNNARLEFSTIFVPSFDPNEWCLKNGLHSGGMNPGPLGHESSALTTRTQLLTFFE